MTPVEGAGLDSTDTISDPASRDGAGARAAATPLSDPLRPPLAAPKRQWLASLRIASGPVDRRALIAALLGAAACFVLACISLMLARNGDMAAPIWLPNAVAVVVLLRARLNNEWLFLCLTFFAGLSANMVAQLPAEMALVFSIANTAEIALVLALTRQGGDNPCDMTRLSDLARFVWAGGLVGPLLSGLLAAPIMASDLAGLREAAVTWFLTNSMAMVLIVPAGLLLVDRLRGTLPPAPARPPEQFALLLGGMTCALLVFNQAPYSLIFLILPITLLHAFRLGSLGTAVHVAGVALVAAAMSWAGLGPIAAASSGGIAQLHLLQAFIAANFLTGLPVAAILAGRDRMMAQLEAGKRQVDLLADNITDAVLRYDLDGVCTYASPSVREVTGAAPEAIIGKRFTDRLHPEARDRVVLAFGRLRDGTSDKERVTYRRFQDNSAGAPVFLEADCAIIRNPETGLREGVVVAARDVTERVELELLLTRARRLAEDAARTKSDFLANMSHEIRTPMNGVLGFAELLLQGDLGPDQRRHAEMIVQSGRSMMMLLNDVLDFSKIESGQFTIDNAPVDLHATLAECAALHRHAAQQKGLTLEFAFDCGDAPDPRPDEERRPWIVSDGLRLRQIILNLLGNAVKFTGAGSIRLTYRVSESEVCITVADTGIGIGAARLETIFQPFIQGESNIARRFGGTGLGLSISRQLATLLGGRIAVTSEPGKGSRFTLTLPTRLARPDIACESAEPSEPGKLPTAARVLLVEDHDINRILMTDMLDSCGQEVAIAHDGNEAIAMVIDSMMRGTLFDLVLMDVQMPGCDGYAATRAIRAEGIGPDLLPIVALTANAFPEDVAAARAAGMQAHLAKPIALADLARALQRWLPTRIVETPPNSKALTPKSAAAGRISPQLAARWETRRHQAVEAVRLALRDGTLSAAQGSSPAGQRVATLLHKLSGSAGMFGEPGLGDSAGALERALATEQSGDTCVALARALLELADRPDNARPRKVGNATS